MELTFYGAAHEVTGSCHMITVNDKHFLVDCGMEQGPDLYENQKLSVDPVDIDSVFLTHAHIDHSGLLPLLCKNGFKGKIYTTKATGDLVGIMLKDSAGIQEFEAAWRNRKATRAGEETYEPLYTTNDAICAIEKIRPIPYGKRISISKGVSIRFTDIGHLLGSASIEVWLTEGQEKRKVVFSGDIGNYDQPILKDPQHTKKADYVVVESTYGDREHGGERPDYVEEISKILVRTFERGGNVVIPSFAVGRTQELLYIIREIKEKDLCGKYNDFKVYVDSPLAIEATHLFNQNMYECFDEEAMKLVDMGINPIVFPGLITTTTTEESKYINFDREPKVIISASGMCEAGRIRHHLKHNLWRWESTILFVGYQASGTLGRKLLEGKKEVTLFGEKVMVEAEILSLKGVSGHADVNGLMDWLKGFDKGVKKVIVVHGEDGITDSFGEKVKNEIGFDYFAPYSGGRMDIISNVVLDRGLAILKEKSRKASSRKSQNAFERVIKASRRLGNIIYKNKGLPNKELAKFESQINNLSDKWDR